jgi:hypothetical protein
MYQIGRAPSSARGPRCLSAMEAAAAATGVVGEAQEPSQTFTALDHRGLCPRGMIMAEPGPFAPLDVFNICSRFFVATVAWKSSWLIAKKSANGLHSIQVPMHSLGSGGEAKQAQVCTALPPAPCPRHTHTPYTRTHPPLLAAILQILCSAAGRRCAHAAHPVAGPCNRHLKACRHTSTRGARPGSGRTHTQRIPRLTVNNDIKYRDCLACIGTATAFGIKWGPQPWLRLATERG